MNCRPGDLARIVGTPAGLGLNNHFVTLKKQPPVFYGDCAHWALEEPVYFTASYILVDVVGKFSPPGTRVSVESIADENLRPIRDPGRDAIDEMVQKLGPAAKTLTEVREHEHG